MATTPQVLTHRIIGTDTTVVEAWEPFANHTAMRSHDDDGWLGLITARPLPRYIELMEPGSRDRMSAAMDFAAANTLDALAAIGAEYPHLLERDDIRIDGGRVLLEGDPAAQPCQGRCGELVTASPEGIAWCGTVGQ